MEKQEEMETKTRGRTMRKARGRLGRTTYQEDVGYNVLGREAAGVTS